MMGPAANQRHGPWEHHCYAYCGCCLLLRRCAPTAVLGTKVCGFDDRHPPSAVYADPAALPQSERPKQNLVSVIWAYFLRLGSWLRIDWPAARGTRRKATWTRSRPEARERTTGFRPKSATRAATRAETGPPGAVARLDRFGFAARSIHIFSFTMHCSSHQSERHVPL
jgi:hypothetical protein